MLSFGFYFSLHIFPPSPPFTYSVHHSIQFRNYMIKVLIHIKYKINFLYTFFNWKPPPLRLPSGVRSSRCHFSHISHSLSVTYIYRFRCLIKTEPGSGKNHKKGKLKLIRVEVLFVSVLSCSRTSQCTSTTSLHVYYMAEGRWHSECAADWVFGIRK